MTENDRLQNEKLASLILLEKYIEENEQDKAFILAKKIEELNRKIELQGPHYQKRK